MRLWYFLRFDSPEYDELATQWEDAAVKFVEENWMDNPLLEVEQLLLIDYFQVHLKHSRIFDQGLTNNSNRLKPYFLVTVVVLIAFTTIYAMKWVFDTDAMGKRQINLTIEYALFSEDRLAEVKANPGPGRGTIFRNGYS